MSLWLKAIEKWRKEVTIPQSSVQPNIEENI
jgi:hypothetical protein